MRHSRIKSFLYEYARGELSEDRMQIIAEHLSSCRHCTREIEEIRTVANLTASHLRDASGQRRPEFWNNFIAAVDRRIDSSRSDRVVPPIRTLESAAAFFRFRQRAIVIAGGALALVLIAFFISQILRVQPAQTEQAARTGDEPVQVTAAGERMGDYLRKSKVLLVGISNLKTDQDRPVDLTAERKVSRQLADQARFLKNQPLDIRSARLIGDLEKILIELANIKEEGGLPNVDMIRSGIHRQNLLFKIRMAEALCDSTKFVQTRDTF